MILIYIMVHQVHLNKVV